MTFTERSLWAGSEVGLGTTVSHPVLLSGGSGPWDGGTSLAHSSQGLDATEYLRSLNSRSGDYVKYGINLEVICR